MAAGDIIIPDNTITPEILEKITSEVVNNIQATSKDPGQYEEVNSLQGITSLPVFQTSGAAYKLVRVAISILRGVDGKEVHLQSTETHLQWRWTDGMWQNLIAWADLKGDTGDTPTFRTGAAGIEWKYAGEPETEWKVLVTFEVLKLKFTDLTADQIVLFWRGVPEDVVVLFQKPATDAAAEVRQEMIHISQDVSQKLTDLRQLEATVEEQEEVRETFYTQTQAKEQARQNDEIKRQEAASAHAATEAARVLKEEERNKTFAEKVKETTDVTERVEKAEEAAITATKNADKATGKANTAADRSNALSDHRDEIRDGYWWRWNEETGEWYNTGEIAKGNVMYAVFDVDPATGELSMFTDDEYTGASFELNNEGILSVII